MKVTHFCTYSVGGAAIAAMRLHRLLLCQGIKSRLVFLYKNVCHEPETYDFRESLSVFNQLKLKLSNKLLLNNHNRKINKHGTPPEYFSFPETVWDISQHPFVNDSDIIHLHWVANFFDYSSLLHKNLINKKIIWTLHDMQPFTGGFHYNNWFDTNPWTEIIKQNKTKIEQYNSLAKIHFICPSNWIKETAVIEGTFANQPHYTFNNPGSDAFFYTSRLSAREQLKLDNKLKYCFIPADNPDYKRKGIDILEKEIAQAKTEYVFITSGNRILNLGNNKQLHIGKINNEYLMNLYYNACDVVLFSSVAENYSNTLVEAKQCGVPIIAFNTGGNSEILSEKTGDIIIPSGLQNQLISKLSKASICEADREIYAWKKQKDTSLNLNKSKNIIELYRGI